VIRLAIIGDVHGHWFEEDEEALKALNVDAAIFVGDFGEEDVALVQRVASVPTPKAVILGNHDAWCARCPHLPSCDALEKRQKWAGRNACNAAALLMCLHAWVPAARAGSR
jgi:3',5'-cyclic AMP phosphodiesterase CpdA